MMLILLTLTLPLVSVDYITRQYLWLQPVYCLFLYCHCIETNQAALPKANYYKQVPVEGAHSQNTASQLTSSRVKYEFNGRYERPQPHHNWNSNHLFYNWALFPLQRHSDHHEKRAQLTVKYQLTINPDRVR